MKDRQRTEMFSNMLIGITVILTLLSCYWFLAPFFARMGVSNQYVNEVLLMYSEYFNQPISLKLFIILLTGCSAAFRMGNSTQVSWSNILLCSAIGTGIFLLQPANSMLYALTSLVGLGMMTYGYSLIARKSKDSQEPEGEGEFKQETQKKTNSDSVNIPYTFRNNGRQHKGWINCINPYRASIVLGSPGSGKSFAIYNAFIEQQLRKGFTMFLYDYKFPDLTERLLTEVAYQSKYEGLWKDMKVKPHLYIINFDNPLKSNRCNPIHHSYITDPADTNEIAELVFLNINKGVSEKGFDFFNESAKIYLDGLIWKLANYDPDAVYNTIEGIEWVREHRGEEAVRKLPREVVEDLNGTWVIDSKSDYKKKGIYCTFPHVIELMASDYKKVFQIMQYTRGMEAKISPFSSALEQGALEQLAGQIASAQIPLGKFVSPSLYWVMSGDDFTLDINNPEAPKIVCMGNNPDRQTIYGTTLALYTARMFKLINHKKKLKSAILLDELPTIFIKGLDTLIATARSNKVAIVVGAQDKSQLYRDYGDKEAQVIMNTVGNLYSGSVSGDTAEYISKSFGKKQTKKVSVTDSDSGESTSTSYQLEDRLPQDMIMDMSQGEFCGWVKDNYGEKISMKKFYGQVQVDAKRNAKLDEVAQKVPMITNPFGDKMPEMTEYDTQRLKLLNPALAKNIDAIYEKFIEEKIREEIDKNFNRIKAEVKEFVKSEYERTSKIVAAIKNSEELTNENYDN